jgi:hypothetical protein
MRYELIDQQQASALMQSLWPKVKAALAAGRKLTLEVKDASKSRETEKMYHAIIGEIAQQASHMGAKWSAEDWKRLLVDQFIRLTTEGVTKVIPNLDNSGIVQLGFQTRNFTQDQASQFVEYLKAWAATNGIELKETA